MSGLQHLLEQATPPRPIPEWWSEEAVQEVKHATYELRALAPDMARLLIDMAAFVHYVHDGMVGHVSDEGLDTSRALLAQFAELDRRAAR